MGRQNVLGIDRRAEIPRLLLDPQPTTVAAWGVRAKNRKRRIHTDRERVRHSRLFARSATVYIDAPTPALSLSRSHALSHGGSLDASVVADPQSPSMRPAAKTVRACSL